MSNILIATTPVVGHVTPLIPIAESLTKLGHEVVWYTSKLFHSRIEGIAQFRPILSAPDYNEEDVPNDLLEERASLKGIQQIKFDLKNFFVRPADGYYQDLEEILTTFSADIIISDSFFIAASWISETFHLKWIQVCVSVLTFNGVDVAPFGLGLQPNGSPIGKLRNHILNLLSHHLIFKETLIETNIARRKIGLKPTQTSFQNMVSPDLYLCGSIPEFEYPRSDLPSSVCFVGPLQSSILKDYELPNWWEEFQENTKPVILVTQGTVATNWEDLLLPSIRALQDEDVYLIATTGTEFDHTLFKEFKSNVKVERFIPFQLLLPHTNILISNGGFNGVMMALSHGIPIVVAGKTEDKAEVSARIQYSGVGINLNTSTPSSQKIKEATLKVLNSADYKRSAMLMQEKIAEHNAVQKACHLIQQCCP